MYKGHMIIWGSVSAPSKAVKSVHCRQCNMNEYEWVSMRLSALKLVHKSKVSAPSSIHISTDVKYWPLFRRGWGQMEQDSMWRTDTVKQQKYEQQHLLKLHHGSQQEVLSWTTKRMLSVPKCDHPAQGQASLKRAGVKLTQPIRSQYIILSQYTTQYTTQYTHNPLTSHYTLHYTIHYTIHSQYRKKLLHSLHGDMVSGVLSVHFISSLCADKTIGVLCTVLGVHCEWILSGLWVDCERIVSVLCTMSVLWVYYVLWVDGEWIVMHCVLWVYCECV